MKTTQIQKVILFSFILLMGTLVNGQLVDKYGIRIGGGISNQYWDYKNDDILGLSGWNDDKLSLSVYINAEKKLTNFLSIRPEIGYLQKGYIHDLAFVGTDGLGLDNVDKRVILHDLSCNIELKISPFDFAIKPYLIAGFRGDYMVGFRGVKVENEGREYEIDRDLIEKFNKFTISGLIGVGFEYKDLLYLDIEFNPAITKNLDNAYFSIKDRYLGATVGFNINTLYE